MQTFCEKCLPLKSTIKSRDESFFLNNSLFFEKVDKSKVNHFRKLWQSDKLDASDKQVIWSWYDSFLALAEKYTKLSV